MPLSVRQITPNDVASMEALSTMFGQAFGEVDTYTGNRPSAAYLQRLLDSDYFIALVAAKNDEIVGGIAAYELRKFEQERSEIYLYDLAVAEAHRREGIATALIAELRKVAAARGAYVIFVQADSAADDQPAIGLYTRLGRREDVLHFDIPVHAVGAPELRGTHLDATPNPTADVPQAVDAHTRPRADGEWSSRRPGPPASAK
jgi:aminoglycoside 3-N-acetyltransferase I